MWGLSKENILVSIKQYKCCYCDKTFSQKCDVNEHYKVSHLGSTLFTCRKCPSSFTSLQEVTSHRLVHKAKTWPWDMTSEPDGFGQTCVDCRKYFTDRQEFLNHLETDCGFKPLTCSKCLLFKTLDKSALEEHIQHHCKVLPYIYCSVCGQHFATERRLRVHREETHQWQTNFRCSVCKTFFSCNISLKLHELENCNNQNT